MGRAGVSGEVLDEKIIEALLHFAKQSNDPKTKTSAIIDWHDIAACNRILEPVPTDRSERLIRSIHAEVAVIGVAAKYGYPVKGKLMYVVGTPCLPCAKSIVAVEFSKVVVFDSIDPFRDRLDDPAYEFGAALAVLEAGGVAFERRR